MAEHPIEAPVALIDTSSLFFRAFYALPPMSTADGAPTSALYGFSVMLLKLLREHQPSRVAFALDLPQRTFRHRRFPAYKAQRARPADPLLHQLQRLPALIQALGVPVLASPGFEADDILATVAEQTVLAGSDALVISGDRDLLQLVRDSVRVLFIGARGKGAILYDADKVLERFGVPARDLPALVALAGDKSDNIPGVPGVGERAAKKLIATYGSVAGVFANVDRVGNARVRAALIEHRDQVTLSEDLVRLRSDVELGTGPYSLPVTREGLAHLGEAFERLEFKSLVPRVKALMDHAH